VLAGTSIALALMLKFQFPGEFCAYCAASIAASLTLYLTAFLTSKDRKKSWSFGGVCTATIAITALYATVPNTVTARALPLASCRCLLPRCNTGAHCTASLAMWCANSVESSGLLAATPRP
jgi:hypothetical protein